MPDPGEAARTVGAWTTAAATAPCPCKDDCQHGHTCELCSETTVHLGRNPDTLKDPYSWCDRYRCGCHTRPPVPLTLPIPWGTPPEPGTTGGTWRRAAGEVAAFAGVRHMHLSYTWPGGRTEWYLHVIAGCLGPTCSCKTAANAGDKWHVHKPA